MKISFRDIRISYIGQNPNFQISPYTSNPANPAASQEYGNSPRENFCPTCKSVNLLHNPKKEITICKDCNSRFSLRSFQQGDASGEREIPRSTGLFNADQGSTSSPDAHSSGEIGGGSFSNSL